MDGGSPIDLRKEESEIVREIDALLAELAGLARQGTDALDFFAQVLTHANFAVSANCAALCRAVGDECLPIAWVQEADAPRVDLQQMVAEIRKLDEPFEPAVIRRQDTDADTNSLVYCPIRSAGELWGFLGLAVPSESSVIAARGQIELASAFSELVEEYLRNQEFRDHSKRVAKWRQIQTVSRSVHEQPLRRPLLSSIVNDTRVALDADRVSFATAKSGRIRLEAASGCDQVDRRSNVVRKLERLCQSVLQWKEPLLVIDGHTECPPPVDECLRDYLQSSNSKLLLILPVRSNQRGNGECLGAWVIEFSRSVDVEASLWITDLLLPHIQSAWSNCVAGSGAGQLFRRKAGWMFVAGLLLAGMLAACLIESDLRIEAEGHLEPVEQRFVFAPYDGLIYRTHVTHGQAVKTGQLLVTIKSHDLEMEEIRLIGELRTMGEKRTGLEVALNQVKTSDTTVARLTLAAEISELDEHTKGVTKQLTLLRKQIKGLEVRSPIDGQVVAWDLELRLRSRPVQRGESLLRIVNPNGPWRVQLHVPDKEMGHVHRARLETNELPVRFIVASYPDQSYGGFVQRIALSTQTPDDFSKPMIPIHVRIDRDALPKVRIGMGVSGKIHCGRRSLAILATRKIYEALQRRWF